MKTRGWGSILLKLKGKILNQAQFQSLMRALRAEVPFRGEFPPPGRSPGNPRGGKAIFLLPGVKSSSASLSSDLLSVYYFKGLFPVSIHDIRDTRYLLTFFREREYVLTTDVFDFPVP